jgi:hypothetical protein
LNYAKGIHCIRDRVKNNKQNKNTYETIDWNGIWMIMRNIRLGCLMMAEKIELLITF